MWKQSQLHWQLQPLLALLAMQPQNYSLPHSQVFYVNKSFLDFFLMLSWYANFKKDVAMKSICFCACMHGPRLHPDWHLQCLERPAIRDFSSSV